MCIINFAQFVDTFINLITEILVGTLSCTLLVTVSNTELYFGTYMGSKHA
jgi:hypothetical protein